MFEMPTEMVGFFLLPSGQPPNGAKLLTNQPKHGSYLTIFTVSTFVAPAYARAYAIGGKRQALVPPAGGAQLSHPDPGRPGTYTDCPARVLAPIFNSSVDWNAPAAQARSQPARTSGLRPCPAGAPSLQWRSRRAHECARRRVGWTWGRFRAGRGGRANITLCRSIRMGSVTPIDRSPSYYGDRGTARARPGCPGPAAVRHSGRRRRLGRLREIPCRSRVRAHGSSDMMIW
jgi:hypothetical protein